jgi:xylulose-5-phosphate/fructose-6-phosphate phosphoketolase
VHGFKEKGTTTTPFDMVVLNEIDRFHLFAAAVARVTVLQPYREEVEAFTLRKLSAHRRYIEAYGIDLPEILEWRWSAQSAAAGS